MTIRDWKGAPSGIAPLPDIDKPRNFRFVQHSHIAKRAGPHKDVRLLDPLSNTTFNWAVKRIPNPGQISLAHPTGFHPAKYLDFQGILKGYGAGKVTIERSETAEVLESQPDKLKFTLFKGRVPEQFAIRHQEGRWMLQNITPSRDVKVWDKLLPKTRPKYKEKRLESLDLSDKDEILQAKIDGANTHVVLRGGQVPRVFSSRESKTSPTKLIEHTFKVRDLMSKKVPEELRDTVLQAELYGTDERGKAVPARLLAGLLNASTPKSREMQQRARQELRLMPFKVLRYKGKETKNLTYDENMRILKDLKEKMPFLQLPVAAETSAEKAELLKRIRIGKEPLTLEGVVAHHRIRPEMTKVKFKPDFDVKIDGVFPSKKPGYAGGFLYKVNGKEGRIGTGFSDKMKKMMAEHPERFKGLVAKVEAQEAFPSGKLRAPAFKEFHLSKNEPERLEKVSVLKTKLQPQQERVVERLKTQPGLVVAHGLGSGKTLTAIATQEALGIPGTVVVPASLKENYQKELKKHLKGKRVKRDILSMQALARSKQEIKAPILIVDEAHRLREPGTSTQAVLGKAEAGKRMLLTASPFYNRPSDIVPLVNIAAGAKVLPEDKREFEKKFIETKKVGPGFFGWLRGIKPGIAQSVKEKEKKPLKDIFSTWVDYHPAASKDYPSVSREVVEVPMGQAQLKIYSAVMNQAPPWVKYKILKGLPPSKTEAKSLNAFLSGTRQISNTTRAFAPNVESEEPKIDEAFKRLQSTLKKDSKAKAFVYSNFLGSGIEPYKQKLESAKIPYGEFTGEMPKKEREALVNKYNKGKLKVLLASSAGGEGLDLTGTRLIQLLEPHWNMEKLKQVEGRGIRYKSHADLPKSKRHVQVQQFLATRSPGSLFERWGWKKPGGSVDQYLYGRAKRKEDIITQFRGLMEEPESGKLVKTAISPAGLEKAVARISAKTGIIPQITRSGGSFAQGVGKDIKVVVRKQPQPIMDITKMHELTEASFMKRPKKYIPFSTHAHPAVSIQDWNIFQTMKPHKAKKLIKSRKEELGSMSSHIGLSKKETQKLLNLPRLSPAAKKRLIVGGIEAGQRTSRVLDKLRATSPSHKKFHDLVEEVTFDPLTVSPKLLNWVEKSLGKLPV